MFLLQMYYRKCPHEALSIFIIYICLKQNYIKQYKSLQTNTLFSGYRILYLTGFAKKTGAIQDF